MKKLTAALLMLAMILTFSGNVYASSIEAMEAELEAIESTAGDIQGDIDATADQRYAVERDLSVVIARKAEVEAEIEVNKKNIIEKEEELEKIRLDLEKAKAEIAAQEDAFGSRLRVMYYKKDESFWNVLFESRSIADLLNRMEQLKAISEQDKKVLEDLNDKRREIEKLEIQEKENYNKLLEMKEQLIEDERELKNLEAELERRRAELLELQRKFEAELEAQNRAAANLAADIEYRREEARRIAAERAAAAAASGGTSRGAGDITVGGWAWPTEARNITSYYGWRTHPVYGGTAWHNGIDIAGPAGTPIWASRGGLVIFAGWNSGGYGNLVIIDHGDGTSSWYAHASSLNVRVGDYVSQYDVVCYMGTTGTSTGNHLHFTIMNGRQDVDPSNYVSP